MLILRGSPALSTFRLAQLLQDIVAAGVPAIALSAEFVHVGDLARELTATERGILDQLLTYGPSRETARLHGLEQIVAPRPGTISPWSSKATDIAHLCGLTAVKRIERVVAYALDTGDTAPPFPLTNLDAGHFRASSAISFGSGGVLSSSSSSAARAGAKSSDSKPATTSQPRPHAAGR